jgi:hypothetical protein
MDCDPSPNAITELSVELVKTRDSVLNDTAGDASVGGGASCACALPIMSEVTATADAERMFISISFTDISYAHRHERPMRHFLRERLAHWRRL